MEKVISSSSFIIVYNTMKVEEKRGRKKRNHHWSYKYLLSQHNVTAKQTGLKEVVGTQVKEIWKNEGGQKVRECDKAGRLEKRWRKEGEMLGERWMKERWDIGEWMKGAMKIWRKKKGKETRKERKKICINRGKHKLESKREWGWNERTERVRDRNRERKSYSGNDVVAMETLSSDYSTGASWVFLKDFTDWWRS